MKRWSIALLIVLASCTPASIDGEPSDPVWATLPATTSVTPTTVPGSTPSTAAEPSTSTTLPDPTGDFLKSLSDAPAVTAVVSSGFRRWTRHEGVWLADPLTSFAGGPFDHAPFAVSTPAGMVFGGADGALYVGEEQVATSPGRLVDVATAGDVAVAIVVDGGRVSAVNLTEGSESVLYEAIGEISSASYANGELIVVRGSGAEAVAVAVDQSGTSPALDLLTEGNARSLVVTPDGRTMVFSTDVPGDATVYTLALGSQGPAAPYPLSMEGPITGLDTDGMWVAGLVAESSFLLELSTGSVFVGPPDVRFTFDRDQRTYVGPGVTRIIDGRFFGWVRSAAGDAISFDEAEFLTGDDAAAAAEAAGEESPPPNDFFIRNTSDDEISIPLAAAADIRIQGNVVQAGIGLEPISLAQWLLLLEGDTTVIDFEWYGAGELPYWITVEGGEVVALEEVYLP